MSAPIITNLSPQNQLAGTAFTLTVDFANVVNPASAVVYQFAGGSLWVSVGVTTYVSPTRVTVAVGVNDFPVGGTYSLRVTTSGGSTSAASLAINSPAPLITFLQPTQKAIGDAAFTLNVNGINFNANSKVWWNGNLRATTFVSDTLVTAAILATDLAQTGQQTVSVITDPPGGGVSVNNSFVVNNPIPTAASLSPSSAIRGSGSTTITLTGTNLVPVGCAVYWDGIAQPTTYISPTKVSFVATAAMLSIVGSHLVHVTNVAPGGGTSGNLTFNVNNPAPIISSLSPSLCAAGSNQFVLTINGANLQPDTAVSFGGVAKVVSYSGPTLIQVVIPAAEVAAGRLVSVSVTNPAPGGGTTTATFTVNNVVPSVSSIAPAIVTSGGAGFALAVSGGSFVPGSTVQVDGSGRQTSFISPNDLTAQLLASDIAAAGTRMITVLSPAPGGGTSSPGLPLTVIVPVAALDSILPTHVVVGTLGFTLHLYGSSFVAGAVVKWAGAARATTFVSASELTAQILDTDLIVPGIYALTVTNPGSVASASVPFSVNNPVPTLSGLSPTSIPAGNGDFTLAVYGGGFRPGGVSTVRWNGQDRATTFISANEVRATILAADVTAVGAASITVFNATPGGGTSVARTFYIQAADNPVPHFTSVTPATINEGSAQFQIDVAGNSFVANSVVRWEGLDLVTTYLSPSALTAIVPASAVTQAGSVKLYVFNPAPAGGLSNPIPFAVAALNPVPTVTDLSPISAQAGAAQFTMHVYGTDFVAGAIVQWVAGGAFDLVTTFVSSTELTAVVPAARVASPGTASVHAFNPTPGGGFSNSITFTIVGATDHPVPSITAISPAAKTVGDTGFTLTVDGNGFYAGSVVKFAGSARATTYVSPTRVTAAILTADLAAAGDLAITVFNTTPGGGTSNAAFFAVNPATKPAPVLASISPTVVPRGAAEFVLAAFGLNFQPDTVLRFGTLVCSTEYVSSTRLNAIIPASAVVAAPGIVTKINPRAHAQVRSQAARAMRLMDAGSAARPSLTVAPNETATGLYSPGPGQAGVAAGGKAVAVFGDPTGTRPMLTVAGFERVSVARLVASNGANHNVVLPDAAIIEVIGPTAGFSFTGFVAGYDGEVHELLNTVAFAMTAENEDNGSDAVNRILTTTGADLVTGYLQIYYSGSLGRWVVRNS